MPIQDNLAIDAGDDPKDKDWDNIMNLLAYHRQLIDNMPDKRPGLPPTINRPPLSIGASGPPQEAEPSSDDSLSGQDNRQTVYKFLKNKFNSDDAAKNSQQIRDMSDKAKNDSAEDQLLERTAKAGSMMGSLHGEESGTAFQGYAKENSDNAQKQIKDYLDANKLQDNDDVKKLVVAQYLTGRFDENDIKQKLQELKGNQSSDLLDKKNDFQGGQGDLNRQNKLDVTKAQGENKIEDEKLKASLPPKPNPIADLRRENNVVNWVNHDPTISKAQPKLDAVGSGLDIIRRIRSGDLVATGSVATQLTNMLTKVELNATGGTENDREHTAIRSAKTNLANLLTFVSGHPQDAVPPAMLDQLETEFKTLGQEVASQIRSAQQALIANTDDPQNKQLLKNRIDTLLKTRGFGEALTPEENMKKAPPQTLKVGDFYKNRQYLGGDKSDPKSWGPKVGDK